MADYKQLQENDYTIDSIILGVRLILAIAKKFENTILDYALGAAILVIIPVYGRWYSLAEDRPLNSSNSENGLGYQTLLG